MYQTINYKKTLYMSVWPSCDHLLAVIYL